VLAEIGEWLKINGEAIYGSRTWKIESEGEIEKMIKPGKHPTWVFDACDGSDIRFTKKDQSLYALVLGPIKGESLLVKSLGTETKISTKGIKNISLLGSKETVYWNRTEKGLSITAPSMNPSDYAIAYKIEIKGDWVD